MNRQDVVKCLNGLSDKELGEFLECLMCTDKRIQYHSEPWFHKVRVLFHGEFISDNVRNLVVQCVEDYFSLGHS